MSEIKGEVEETKTRAEILKEGISSLEKAVEEKASELAGLKAKLNVDMPPESFDPAWSRRNRALTRAQAAAERELQEARLKLEEARAAFQRHLKALNEEAARQLQLDQSWWLSQRQRWQQRELQKQDREDKRLVNPVLTDLRLRIENQQEYSRVKEALTRLEDPKILKVIARARPDLGLTHITNLAKRRIWEWEQRKSESLSRTLLE